ncbi:MAG: HAMP domain-containing histidine kinase [Clostridia bacterium]|nr:HAMP domain-containing histidine kinase [Clostridia bacterium]MDD7483227.1 HAMP domain-containing sensor histidine kinase [Clostridia bacterium]MDY5558258.1 HAMP domain-containing sensor histidine kinase [Candidatus Heritagella sp.]
MRKSIMRRWVVNNLSIIVAILVTLIVVLSNLVYAYVYNGIQQVLKGRSDELTIMFADYSDTTPAQFYVQARNYVENFPDKSSMEVSVINAYGNAVLTSTGFAPDNSQPKPDYDQACRSSEGFGTWTGTLTSGEKVMAVTRVLHDQDGGEIGAIRYVVSMDKADKQILTLILVLVSCGLLVIGFVVVSSAFFLRSIVRPIRQVGASARRIAQGDFNVRIEKKSNDELGYLCDSINEMAAELGTAEKMKNDFISSVSHELRTPLTAIKGWAETLQSGGVTDGMMERGMSVIIRESERLSGLVEELLDFSRMQSGRMTLMMDKLDILAELGEAVYMFSERASAEHKQLLYEEPEMLPPVLGDINRLRQVFVNIIDNALKYTEEGGTIQVQVKLLGNNIVVTISDNGCGIPAEHLPKVKQKFYKANQTVRGSGIGLALADEIIALHSGTLTIESQENVGTVVTITLPALPAAILENSPEGGAL